jgi:hypothetical protein
MVAALINRSAPMTSATWRRDAAGRGDSGHCAAEAVGEPLLDRAAIEAYLDPAAIPA